MNGRTQRMAGLLATRIPRDMVQRPARPSPAVRNLDARPPEPMSAGINTRLTRARPNGLTKRVTQIEDNMDLLDASEAVGNTQRVANHRVREPPKRRQVPSVAPDDISKAVTTGPPRDAPAQPAAPARRSTPVAPARRSTPVAQPTAPAQPAVEPPPVKRSTPVPRRALASAQPTALASRAVAPPTRSTAPPAASARSTARPAARPQTTRQSTRQAPSGGHASSSAPQRGQRAPQKKQRTSRG